MIDDVLKDLDDKLKGIGKSWEKPKPVYTKGFQNTKPKSLKQDTQSGIETAKVVINETKKTITALHEIVKNRKIHKLEREAEKTKEEADQLAHEIKTKTALIDSMNDKKRYQKEKEKIDQELEQIRKEEKK